MMKIQEISSEWLRNNSLPRYPIGAREKYTQREDVWEEVIAHYGYDPRDQYITDECFIEVINANNDPKLYNHYIVWLGGEPALYLQL